MSNLIRRRELLLTSMAAPLAAWGAQSARSPRKMNVLMIAVDDLNNRLGCYGDPIVKSPNIDKLAARGVRFDHAYCNYPLCNPTRTSLLSGKRPDTTRIFDNNTPPRTYLGKDVVFLPEYFHKFGYFTARVGKIAHGAFEYEVSWDISENTPTRDGEGRKIKAGRKGGVGREASETREGGIKLSWTKTGRNDSEEPDGMAALRVVQLLEQNKDRPFFIGAGFHKPHLPWVAPKKYFDMYPPDQVIMPNTPADDRDDIPPIALTHTAGDETMTEYQKREAVAAYHACTTFTDHQVGVLMDAMDRLKLWDNTVVFLFGDHGWHLNDHLGLWRKMTVFEEAARAPLIMVAPGHPSGVGCPRLVEYVDLYPTLTQLCGLPQNPGMEGTSFVPLLDDPQRPWKKAAFTVVARGKQGLGRSVRTERYRYTEWLGNEHVAELYDHEKDIHEWTNLAWNDKPSKVREDLKQLLHTGWKAALPPQ